MKRIIWAVVLLITTLGIYFMGLFVVNDICKNEISDLKQCLDDIESGNIEKAKKTLKKDKELNRLTHYIYRTKIEDIEDTLKSGYYYLLENDLKESKICINKSIDLLDEVDIELKVSLETLF